LNKNETFQNYNLFSFITPKADEGFKYLAACREIFSSLADTPLLAAGYFIMQQNF
jgi:hypothetical protein